MEWALLAGAAVSAGSLVSFRRGLSAGCFCRRSCCRCSWVVLLIMMAAVAAPAAQDHPDFSGRWILESASAAGSDVPRAMSVHQLLVLRDVRGEPMAPFFKQITVDREFESSRRSDTHDIGVVGGVVPGRGADGSPTGPHRSHAVTWEGDALVFDSGSYTGPAPEQAYGPAAARYGPSTRTVGSKWSSRRGARWICPRRPN